jgi:LuxR family transcriptional regulator, maltose regulon positive regulatory protein
METNTSLRLTRGEASGTAAANEQVVAGRSPPPRLGQTSTGRTPPVVARRALFERLSAGAAGGVTLVSAPAGSGKTVLLRSWIEDAGLAGRVAWVAVERGERDAQRFWLAVIEKLRAAIDDSAFVEKLTPTPEFTGEAVVARLVAGLGSLQEPVVLVIDDLHELRSAEALAQLEALLAQRPPLLHVVLATRRDPQLGLHRLRLAGQLTELRAADLCFTLEQTRELLTASGIALSDEGVARLQARTEGWAAGLRLAALSLAGHPEPERFVAEFSGSERTVAEYLLAEVLEHQPEDVRRLLLRTSILEWVNGALADVLTGTAGSERILHALEEANAFVVAVDAERSCFRYHHLFADLLRLELRRTEPDVVPVLHRAAAAWHDAHGFVVEAIRHAQAAEDWGYAARLLADHAFSLALDGQGATIGALLAAFPADARSNPELAAIFAHQQLARGSLDDAAAYVAVAERHAAEVPTERRHRFEVSLAVARLSLARRRGDFGSVLREVQALLAPGGGATLHEVALGKELRALALMNLGIVEVWSHRFEDARVHLERGVQLARRAGRPYVEVGCLAHLGVVAALHSFALAREHCLEALAIAEAHGWATEPIACVPLTMIGAAAVAQGRFEEGGQWLDRAEQALRPDLEPAVALWVRLQRGLQNAIQGRFEQALAAFSAAERLQMLLVTPHTLTVLTRQWLVLTHLQLGDMAAARATLAKLSDEEREWGEARIAAAALHLAEGDPQAAIEVLAPVLDGTAPVLGHFSLIPAPLLDAMARDRLGDSRAAEAGVERALDIAERDGLVLSFVLTQSRDLLERHPRHRTAHAALLANILDVFAGSSLPARAGAPPELHEDLSEGELRVLRYLPSHLSTPEIGAELYLSLNTVKTHMRHIYAKLGVHGRTEAVERARELGLLGPSSRR